MKRIILYLIIFLCLSSTHAFAEKKNRDGYEMFQLFLNCEPMYLLVEGLSPHALEIGLSKKSIRNAVESRLRSAHLYSNKMLNSYLYVNVNVLETAFSMSVTLYKKVVDSYFTGFFGTAATWDRGSTGTHGGNFGFILSAVSQKIDEFLVDFLRVNGEACRKKHPSLK